MAREALKALSRQRVKFNDIPDFFDALNSETARSVAILAATGVEDALEFAIVARLVHGLSATDFTHLFDGDNPLSTFSAKIKIGHALGLYGHLYRADLNCIRDIRNAFAHSKAIIDFDHPDVASACKELNGPFGKDTDDKKHWAPRERFIRTASEMHIELLGVETSPPVKTGLP